MATTKKSTRLKEPVKVRTKKLADGSESYYLDIYVDGKRSYEFLKLYLLPEINPMVKEQNRATKAAVEAIKSKRIIELTHSKAGLKKTSVRSKMLLDDWMEAYLAEQERKGARGLKLRHAMSDNEYDVHLWLRIERGGEIAAFRELFDRYYAPLCRFAEFWLRDRASAEEVVLDVYTHVWQHAAELRITVSVRAYLFRAVRNRALNRLRDDRFSYIPFEELGEVFASPESLQIETDEITQLVAEAVSQLPGRCRDIFLKSRNEQLSNAEIAAEMHISVKTVEAQMSKALRRLRGLLHKE